MDPPKICRGGAAMFNNRGHTHLQLLLILTKQKLFVTLKVVNFELFSKK